MARKTKKTTVKRKKTTKKNSSKNRIKKPLTGFPKKMLMRLRLVDEDALNPGAGAIDATKYRANDVFNPLDEVGAPTRHPLGFDQAMSIYHHFVVIGSKISVMVVPSGTSNGNVGYLGITKSQTGTAISAAADIVEVLEQNKTSSIKLAGSYFTTPPTYVKTSLSTKKFFAKKDLLDDNLLRGGTSSPTSVAYYEVFYASAGAQDSAAINIKVTIDYLVLFTEPKYLPYSHV